MREPGVAPYQYDVKVEQGGYVTAIDNRRLTLAAKPAGAPADPRAGIDLRVKLGQRVGAGETLYAVHAASPGELDYALDYLARKKNSSHSPWAGRPASSDPHGCQRGINEVPGWSGFRIYSGLVLEKIRRGDAEPWREHTTVPVDDIIFTGHSMAATIEYLH